MNEEKMVKWAYAAPVLAAVVRTNGCDNLDDCIDKTLYLITKLDSKL